MLGEFLKRSIPQSFFALAKNDSALCTREPFDDDIPRGKNGIFLREKHKIFQIFAKFMLDKQENKW